VKRVQVFQSEFVIEQMTKDKLYGPSDIWKKSNGQKVATSEENSDEDESLSKKGDEDEVSEGSEETDNVVNQYMKMKSNNSADKSDFDLEKLRAYEASKVKYFFAVTEFTNPQITLTLPTEK
jgi:hypothetical protein